MKKKVFNFLLYFFIFILSVFLSISKTSGWIISSLEMLKLRWAFNTSKTFVIYFPNILQWLLNLDKNGVGQFSLNYILSAPLLYIFDEEIGFKMFFAIFGGLNAVFVYFLINKIFKPKNIKEKIASFLSSLLLVFSWGFSALSGLCLMEPSMTFFLLLAFYFFLQGKYFLFGIFVTIGALCKMPVLAIAPGLFIYIFLFKRKLFTNKKLLLSGLSGFFLFFGINVFVVKNVIAPQWILADAIPSPAVMGSFGFSHLKNLFVSAPILTILGVLGLFNLNKKERDILLPVLFSLISLTFFYFSASTRGSHYIYFLLPFLAIFYFFFLRGLSIKNILVLFLINLVIFIYSFKYEPVFTGFHKKNLPQLIEIVNANLLPGEFILTHAGVWDYYIWGKPYSIIKDIEWYGSSDILRSDIPSGYIENSGIIILEKPTLNKLFLWPYFDQFQFEKEIDNWYIFTRKRIEYK